MGQCGKVEPVRAAGRQFAVLQVRDATALNRKVGRGGRGPG